MRVLFIAETYPPDYGGGAAIFIQEICRFLAGRGHEVKVICAEANEDKPYTVRTSYDDQVQVERVNLPYFKNSDPDGWQLGFRKWIVHERHISNVIRKSIEGWMPDIIHYNTARPFGEECLATISQYHIPIIVMFHEAWLICPRLNLNQSPQSRLCEGPAPLRCLECMYSYYDKSHFRAMAKLPWRIPKLGLLPAYRLWRRWAIRRADVAGIGYSKFMTQKHRPHIPGPVAYIPLGIDLSEIPPHKSVRPRKPLRFGFVGGFQSIKGIWHVLDAARNLKKSGLDFELHIWGPGQESNHHEINLRELEDRTIMRGMYSQQDKWEVYNEIDVAIMATTVCETLGRVTLEAAAVGAPTIAPAVGGITETIEDGVDGLLYRFRDPKDLERQMRRILEEPDLLKSLISGLKPVPDTRARAIDVEKFYFDILGYTPEQSLSRSI